jgi:hypothetical protein
LLVVRYAAEGDHAEVKGAIGSSLSYQVALDTNLMWTSLGIYNSPAPLALGLNSVAQLGFTNGSVIPEPVEGYPVTIGSPGQMLYTGFLNLADRQVSQLKAGKYYIEASTPRFRYDNIGGRITPN